ncbi:MAG: serine hydrolase domain-containing protein, partial [Candidatus Heimdallarchaeaceae archaeon]
INKLEEKCKKIIEETSVPGLSVALFSSEKIIWMKGFGYTDRKKTREVDENTRFAYASTGKSLVSAVAMKSVQDGLIKLDDPLIKHYPEFFVQSKHEEEAHKKITFRHLLSHTSSLPTEGPPGTGFDENGKEYDPTFEEKIKSLQGCWLIAPVGSRARYSNFGFDLTAYGLQRASGKSYPEFVKESFANHLGITSIIYEREEALKEENTAKGQLGQYEAIIRNSHDYGAGAPFLSIKDLATFARFLLGKGKIEGKTIVKEEYLDEMFKGDYSEDFFDGAVARFTNYGLGMFLNSINETTKVFHHPGGAFGYGTTMVIVPEYNIGVVMHANDEYNDQITPTTIEAISSMLEELNVEIKEKEKIDRRKDPAVELKIEELKKFEGKYGGVGSPELKVYVKDDTLYLATHKLIPHSNQEFSAERLLVVRFEINEQGIPERVIFLHIDHGWWRAKFTEKLQAMPKQSKEGWEDFKGLYICYFYGIERSYFVITSNEENLIETSGSSENELYESNVKPNLFFTSAGNGYEFKEDYLLIGGNVKTFRYEKPVQELTELAETEPKHRYLSEYNMTQLENMLRVLERVDEAESIKKLNERLNKD